MAAKDLNWMDIPVTHMPPLPTPSTLADAPNAPPHESALPNESKTGAQLTEITWIIYGSLVVLGYLIKTYHFRLVNGSPNIFLAT